MDLSTVFLCHFYCSECCPLFQPRTVFFILPVCTAGSVSVVQRHLVCLSPGHSLVLKHLHGPPSDVGGWHLTRAAPWSDQRCHHSEGDGDNDEGVLVTIWILHKKKKSVITIIILSNLPTCMCVSYEYEVSQIIFPRYLNSAPMSSSAWCRTDCHCRIHSFNFGLHFTCTQGHGSAAASPCCLGVKAGFRSGRVTSSSQVQHSETNTIKLTMFSLGGRSANTAVYILVALCLNSPIESWSWSLVFHIEIQFPWQQPSISLLSKYFYPPASGFLIVFSSIQVFLFSFCLCSMCVRACVSVLQTQVGKHFEHFP